MKNERDLSNEEVAILNAAFKLYEILILHRCYKRGRRGYHQFTKGAVLAAEKALAGLRPPSPGADPVRVLAHVVRDPGIAKAAIGFAIEEAKMAKQEMWENIRGVELSDAELKALNDEAPIFKMYRGVTTLDTTIKELSHPDFASTAADLVCRLANKAALSLRV